MMSLSDVYSADKYKNMSLQEERKGILICSFQVVKTNDSVHQMSPARGAALTIGESNVARSAADSCSAVHPPGDTKRRSYCFHFPPPFLPDSYRLKIKKDEFPLKEP